jgi:hypothetical protein
MSYTFDWLINQLCGVYQARLALVTKDGTWVHASDHEPIISKPGSLAPHVQNFTLTVFLP